MIDLAPLLWRLVGLAAGLAVLALLVRAVLHSPFRRWPLRGKRALMSGPERRLYQLLGRAAPGLLVFTQVSVLQIIEFEQRGTRLFWTLFRRLGPMSVDFVLCHPDGRIVACIELDDSSHALPRRIAADQVKDRAFKDAGLVLLRIPLSNMPSFAELASAIQLLMEKPIESLQTH
ncbi:MAG: hypothetical protein B7X43_01110 [Thiomonas sp. 15-63-373]|nr:MAG: hypothetical protein B7X43_01110 [Thiomonas sp. 15-63-373]